jgi:holin-like protein
VLEYGTSLVDRLPIAWVESAFGAAAALLSPWIREMPAYVGLVLSVLLLLLLDWLGDEIARATGWPVPGAVLGMLLLLLGLTVLGRVPIALERVCTPTLRHLMLFLIPSIVGATAYFNVIEEHAIALVLTVAASTVLTTVVTAFVLKRLQRGRTQA